MKPLEKDIHEWIKKTFKKVDLERFRRIKNILRRGGWNLDKYHPSMRPELHRWLTDWYTLSVKRLPKPATLRKNPDINLWEEIQDGPWKIKYFRKGIQQPLYLGPYETKSSIMDRYAQLVSRSGIYQIEIQSICPYCSTIECDLEEDCCDAASFDEEGFFV